VTPRVPEVEMLGAFEPWIQAPSRVRDLHVLIRTRSRVWDRDSHVHDRTPSRVWVRHMSSRTPRATAQRSAREGSGATTCPANLGAGASLPHEAFPPRVSQTRAWA
jgi:hypothetical protein